jgi:membrane protein required for colicin V production
MNLLDYIIIITLAYLIVKGIFRGFMKEIASLAGIVLGIVFGVTFLPEMTDFLKPYLPFTQLLPLISLAIIFILVLIICNFLGWFLKKLFQKVFLGWFDRSLGAGFAVVKGVVLTYFVIVILSFFPASQAPLVTDSRLAPWIIRSYQSMINIVSPDQYQRWKEKLLGEKKKVEEMVTDKIKGAANGG